MLHAHPITPQNPRLINRRNASKGNTKAALPELASTIQIEQTPKRKDCIINLCGYAHPI